MIQKLTYLICFTTLFSLPSHARRSVDLYTGNRAVCQSNSYCAHGNMPLFDQEDPSFLRIVGQQGTKVGKTFCGAASSAMVFKTYVKNLKGYEMNRSSSKARSYLNLFSYGRNADVIHRSGSFVGTDYKNGYTNRNNYEPGFKKFLKLVTKSSYRNSHYYKYPVSSNKPVLQKSIFRSKKPISLLRLESNSGAHIVALNGYQGSKFIIYDPWKRIYNVSMIGKNKIGHASGYGYVKSKGGSSGVKVEVKASLVNSVSRASVLRMPSSRNLRN